MSDEQSAPTQFNPLAGGVKILLALVAILVAVFACNSNNPGTTKPTSSSSETIRLVDGNTVSKYAAQTMCESEIIDRLVSPGSAKFQRPTWLKTGNQWRVTSVVDSQNSFGALLRTTWLCVLDGTADTITVEQQR